MSAISATDEVGTTSEAPRPLRPLWRWLRGFLIANLVASAVYFFALALGRLSASGLFGAPVLSGLVYAIIELATLLTFYACAFLWLRFVYRAMRNLHVTGAAGLTITRLGAVIWHFIPVASFWMPFRAIRQIWRSSHDPDRPDAVRVPPQVGWWWALWLVGIVIDVALIHYTYNPGAVLITAELQMASSAVAVPLCLLALWFTAQIVQAQERLPVTRAH